jgi:lysophospholipase L1-like esterase
MARVIRDLPADIITLKLGINIHGQATLTERTFGSSVIGFVQLIREKHPQTPIGLITPIFACERETQVNSAQMTLESYRKSIREVYKLLKAYGDENIFLFEGTELLGEAEAALLPDHLHPNGEGYELMGKRAAEKILPWLLCARA